MRLDLHVLLALIGFRYCTCRACLIDNNFHFLILLLQPFLQCLWSFLQAFTLPCSFTLYPFHLLTHDTSFESPIDPEKYKTSHYENRYTNCYSGLSNCNHRVLLWTVTIGTGVCEDNGLIGGGTEQVYMKVFII